MHAPLERVTDPQYVSGVADADIDLVRHKRQECQDIENGLSYVRRIVHGRLDIVRGELERRRSGAEPAALDELIARLPDLLSDHSRTDGLPRPPQDLAPDAQAEELVAEFEARFPASSLADLPALSIDDLGAMVDRLAEFERAISEGRVALHGVIDLLHEEIVRRYQAGDATVDSLLN